MPDEEEQRERFQISVGQVAASSLAAVSAAVVCSFFGVAGTVIGTAIASLVATVGGALYSYSLRRTRARLRRLHRAGAAAPPLREVWRTARQTGRQSFDRVEWAAVVIGTGAVFVLAIGVVAVIEDATNLNGAPLHHHRHHHAPATPIPAITPTSPSSPSPTVTPAGKPSASTSPSGTSTPSPSGIASPPVSPSPSLSTSPSDTPSPSDSPPDSATPAD